MSEHKCECQVHKQTSTGTVMYRDAPNFSLCPVVFHKRMLQAAISQPLYLEFSKGKLD